MAAVLAAISLIRFILLKSRDRQDQQVRHAFSRRWRFQKRHRPLELHLLARHREAHRQPRHSLESRGSTIATLIVGVDYFKVVSCTILGT